MRERAYGGDVGSVFFGRCECAELSRKSYRRFATELRGRGYELVVNVGENEIIAKVFTESQHEKDSSLRVRIDAESSFVLADAKGVD